MNEFTQIIKDRIGILIRKQKAIKAVISELEDLLDVIETIENRKNYEILEKDTGAGL